MIVPSKASQKHSPSGKGSTLIPHNSPGPLSGSRKHTTAPPRATTGPPVFRTQTLSGVTGAPGSFSQTKTTDSHGHPTILPLWFGPLGAAIVVAPVAAGVIPGIIPPPPGLPPLEIGPDGKASSAKPDSQRQTSNHKASSKKVKTPTISPSHPSSVVSSSISPSSSAPADTTRQMIFPKNRQSPANAAFSTQLQNEFGYSVRPIQSSVTGVIAWVAYMSAEQITKYKVHPLVSTLLLMCDEILKSMGLHA